VKDLRLAKVLDHGSRQRVSGEGILAGGMRVSRVRRDFPNQHRALTPALELAAILCHVESRVIGNDYTFPSPAALPDRAQPCASGMRPSKAARGTAAKWELHARYQQRYLNIAECGRAWLPRHRLPKPVRKDHNAEAKRRGCRLLRSPSPPLWKAIGE